MNEEDIPDLNLFMMCEQVNTNAYRESPDGYSIRCCRPDELDIWKAFPFDTPELAKEYYSFMNDFYDKTYAHDKKIFFNSTLFACDRHDNPVATCGSWKAYGQFQTIHWLKTLKNHEGRGLGKALFTQIMKRFEKTDYPIYLHTHPSGFRAVKLYSDFGFKLLSGNQIGNRKNDLEASLPILKQFMPEIDYAQLKITEPPSDFLDILKDEGENQF